jgi:hypothetical protein
VADLDDASGRWFECRRWPREDIIEILSVVTRDEYEISMVAAFLKAILRPHGRSVDPVGARLNELEFRR